MWEELLREDTDQVSPVDEVPGDAVAFDSAVARHSRHDHMIRKKVVIQPMHFIKKWCRWIVFLTSLENNKPRQNV